MPVIRANQLRLYQFLDSLQHGIIIRLTGAFFDPLDVLNDAVFVDKGLEDYRAHQAGLEEEPLKPGTGFSLVRLGRQNRPRSGSSEVPHIVRLVRLAEEFQAKLDVGDVNRQAELARFYCMTRARVSQLMKLLSLHPEIR